MKNSTKKHSCFAVFAILISFLLAGCQNMANPPDFLQSSGHTGIWLEIGGQGTPRGDGARTAIPELAGLYYSLLFTPEDGDAVFLDLSGDTALRIELEPGTWRVDVRAFLTEAAMADINNAIAAGSVTGIQVTEGHITPLNVALGPVDSGSGSLGYTVSFPSEVSEARLVITYLVTGAKQIINLLSGAGEEAGTKTAVGTLDPINAGYYRMDIALTILDPEFIAGKRAGVSEVVHIYQDTATPVAHTFTAGNFAGSATLIFDSLADFSAYMTTAQTNSAATPYNVVLDGVNLEDFAIPIPSASSFDDPVRGLFNAFNGKYIALDLSGCTGTSIASLPSWSNSSVNDRPDKDKLVSVMLSGTLQILGDYTFSGCTSLVSVNLPAGLQRINASTFQNCTSLISIDLPAGLQTIGRAAFAGCTNLVPASLPTSLQSLDTLAFANCTSLASVNLPDSLQSIGANAFDGCTSLESVNLPDGLQSIGNLVFQNCKNVASLELPASPLWNVDDILTYLGFGPSANLTTITVRGEGLLSVTADKKCLLRGTEMIMYPSASGEVSLPIGIATVGKGLFSTNTAVTKITLPASVISLGDMAFSSTPNLTILDLSACTGMTAIGGVSLFDGSGITSFTPPPNLETLTRVPPKLTSFTLPSKLKTLGGFGGGFDPSKTLTTVDFTPAAGTLTKIAPGAFRDCTNLTTLIGLENCTALEELGEQAFQGATKLTSIELPAGVTSIGNYAFANCPITVTVRAVAPPGIASNSFTAATLVAILVPAGSVDAYEAATNWSTFAAKISAIP